MKATAAVRKGDKVWIVKTDRDTRVFAKEVSARKYYKSSHADQIFETTIASPEIPMSLKRLSARLELQGIHTLASNKVSIVVGKGKPPWLTSKDDDIGGKKGKKKAPWADDVVNKKGTKDKDRSGKKKSQPPWLKDNKDDKKDDKKKAKANVVTAISPENKSAWLKAHPARHPEKVVKFAVELGLTLDEFSAFLDRRLQKDTEEKDDFMKIARKKLSHSVKSAYNSQDGGDDSTKSKVYPDSKKSKRETEVEKPEGGGAYSALTPGKRIAVINVQAGLALAAHDPHPYYYPAGISDKGWKAAWQPMFEKHREKINEGGWGKAIQIYKELCSRENVEPYGSPKAPPVGQGNQNGSEETKANLTTTVTLADLEDQGIYVVQPVLGQYVVVAECLSANYYPAWISDIGWKKVWMAMFAPGYHTKFGCNEWPKAISIYKNKAKKMGVDSGKDPVTGIDTDAKKAPPVGKTARKRAAASVMLRDKITAMADDVLGQTKSGKPIHNNHGHASHQNFTAADHRDAHDRHHVLKQRLVKKGGEHARESAKRYPNQHTLQNLGSPEASKKKIAHHTEQMKSHIKSAAKAPAQSFQHGKGLEQHNQTQ